VDYSIQDKASGNTTCVGSAPDERATCMVALWRAVPWFKRDFCRVGPLKDLWGIARRRKLPRRVGCEGAPGQGVYSEYC